MAFFYGVYPDNVDLEASLDLIRFFAEPDFFRRTHITIRGPYIQRLSNEKEKEIEQIFAQAGRRLEIVGVGSFFIARERSTQNTVILKCELEGAERVWKKPDFRDGLPHITLYDGPSRNFALVMRHTLRQYDWQFSTKTTPIQVLEKKKDPKEFLQIYFQRAQSICDFIFSGDVKIDKFDMPSDLERIYLIDKVSRHIHTNIIRGRSYVY